MSFIIGMLISAGLILCLMLEATALVRPLFSVIFLGGIIAAIVWVILIGMALTPFFAIGFVLNVLLFLPVLGNHKGDGK